MKKINYKDLTLINTCPFCGNKSFVDVTGDDYFAWVAGDLIQGAFPYLSAGEREIIKTGICPACWDGMFPPCDEEEDDSDDYIIVHDFTSGEEE